MLVADAKSRAATASSGITQIPRGQSTTVIPVDHHSVLVNKAFRFTGVPQPPAAASDLVGRQALLNIAGLGKATATIVGVSGSPPGSKPGSVTLVTTANAFPSATGGVGISSIGGGSTVTLLPSK